MTTTTEIATLAWIWILTAVGGFFTVRKALKKRAARRAEGASPGSKHPLHPK